MTMHMPAIERITVAYLILVIGSRSSSRLKSSVQTPVDAESTIVSETELKSSDKKYV